MFNTVSISFLLRKLFILQVCFHFWSGTCVNVGCIPKKLFHFSALTAEHHHDSVGMGWETNAKHNWQNMVDNVNNYIRSLNWNYKTTLAEKEVQYFNAFATFTGPHTLELEDKKGTKTSVSAKFILIACGGRPNLGGYPGAEVSGLLVMIFY